MFSDLAWCVFKLNIVTFVDYTIDASLYEQLLVITSVLRHKLDITTFQFLELTIFGSCHLPQQQWRSGYFSAKYMWWHHNSQARLQSESLKARRDTLVQVIRLPCTSSKRAEPPVLRSLNLIAASTWKKRNDLAGCKTLAKQALELSSRWAGFNLFWIANKLVSGCL